MSHNWRCVEDYEEKDDEDKAAEAKQKKQMVKNDVRFFQNGNNNVPNLSSDIL